MRRRTISGARRRRFHCQVADVLSALVPLWLSLCVTSGVLAGTLPLAPGYGDLGYELPPAGSYKLPILGPAGNGVVLDSEGLPHTLHELFGGKTVLLGFIYSRCSDVNGCPLTSYVFYKLKSMLQSRPAMAARLKLISLSFDPQFDTPAVMKRYAQNFKYAGSLGEWDFVTTRNRASLKPILDAYGQDIKVNLNAGHEGHEGSDGSGGNISHILRVYLIDPAIQIRNIYSVSFMHPELILRDLETLMSQAQKRLHARRSKQRSTTALGHSLLRSPAGLPVLSAALRRSLSPQRIMLGRRLFFDRRLSLNKTISCAMCHIPEQGFTSNELQTAVGIEGRTVRRNAPSLFNVGYMQRLFHDGRENRLEQQIWGPLLNRNEMGNAAVGVVLDTINSLPGYAAAFKSAFPTRGLSMETLGVALASYERTLVSGNSAFDRFYFLKEEHAMNDEARQGFRLFTGKAACNGCHLLGKSSALFTDHRLHNTGIGYAHSMGRSATRTAFIKRVPPRKKEQRQTTRVQLAPGVFVNVAQDIIESVAEEFPADLGYYEITENPADRWKYLTPGLRNVSLTAPYMHDGSLATLADVVSFYNAGGVPNANLDPRIRPLGLSEQEQAALVAFLNSLTGDNVQQLIAEARTEAPSDTVLAAGRQQQ